MDVIKYCIPDPNPASPPPSLHKCNDDPMHPVTRPVSPDSGYGRSPPQPQHATTPPPSPALHATMNPPAAPVAERPAAATKDTATSAALRDEDPRPEVYMPLIAAVAPATAPAWIAAGYRVRYFWRGRVPLLVGDGQMLLGGGGGGGVFLLPPSLSLCSHSTPSL